MGRCQRGAVSWAGGSQRSPVSTDFLPNACPVGLRKCWRGLLGPSLAPQRHEPARAGPTKPKKGICTLVQEGMATDDGLQGMVPKTKRKGSELFLGHVQNSCLPEGGPPTLRPLPPCPGPASSRPCTFFTWSAVLTARGSQATSHGLRGAASARTPAWAGRARTQARLLGPADSDMTGPTLTQPAALLGELEAKR